MTPPYLLPQEAVSAWNRRAPEPGTSVIRWTRYDGAPETLPKETELVLWDNEVCLLSHSETGLFWHYRERYKNVTIGDVWAYLPTPPDGME